MLNWMLTGGPSACAAVASANSAAQVIPCQVFIVSLRLVAGAATRRRLPPDSGDACDGRLLMVADCHSALLPDYCQRSLKSTRFTDKTPDFGAAAPPRRIKRVGRGYGACAWMAPEA